MPKVVLNRTYCKPCAVELEKKYPHMKITALSGKAQKAHCDGCDRQRYALEYKVEYSYEASSKAHA